MNMRNIKKLNYIFFIFLVLFILIGIFFRAYFYSFGRTFWNDECALALNIINYNNYFSILAYNQAAPPLFMYFSKVIYSIFPFKTEFILRIIPFLSSIIAIPIFYKITDKILNNNISKLLAILLFSINYQLCYYCQEFKQYSTDVLSFLSIILFYLYIDIKKLKHKQIIIYSIIFAFSIWISNIAIIAIATIAILYLLNSDYTKEFYKKIVILFSPTILSIGAYTLVCYKTITNPFLHNYWNNYFINKGFYKFILLSVENLKYFFSGWLLVGILAFISIIICAKNLTKKENQILLLPLIITLSLSVLEIYPFSKRLILFLVPIIILLIAKITCTEKKILSISITIFISIFIIFPDLIYTTHMIINKKYHNEDILKPLNLTKQLIKPKEKLFIGEGSQINFVYYSRFYNFNDVEIIVDNSSNSIIENYKIKLDNLPKGKYYYIFGHHTNQAEWLNFLYTWAKQKTNSQIYIDESGNTLLIFTIF